MKNVYLTFLLCACLWPAVSMAQNVADDVDAAKMEAKLNTDGYPYSVLAGGPILAPEERRKLRENQIRYEQYLEAREEYKARQFQAMSADERRYVIEHEGFPRKLAPGYE